MAGRLTPEGKQALSATIRGLRERLLRDIGDEAERRYRLSVSAAQSALVEARLRQRKRLEAWLDERVRASGAKTEKETKAVWDRSLAQAVKEAAATLLNRMVLLRHMEAMGLAKPAVVTGGWNSAGYREFRDFAPGLCRDDSEGYGTLLKLRFDELALDLPGLFGEVGLVGLFAVPPATLREVVERLDDREIESAWTDDTTLGWVYQYWNDPEREALDAKIADGGKIEPHEIASKTQMFTERYMVEWLLQNSLGLTWLGICRRNGWTAEAESVLPGLEARREEWRGKRERGEVALDALMPVEGELEEAWKYFVPQPLPGEEEEEEEGEAARVGVGVSGSVSGSGQRGTASVGVGVSVSVSGSGQRGTAGVGGSRERERERDAIRDPSDREPNTLTPTRSANRKPPTNTLTLPLTPTPAATRKPPTPTPTPTPAATREPPTNTLTLPLTPTHTPTSSPPDLPRSIRDVRLLDPACGSGHFLCSAFDLLVGMYREEATHRGEVWGDREIAESILTRNLHGVDIDPRAVQIAAAGLFLKARVLAREARPGHLNLVAPTLQLGKLPDDDPGLVALRRELKNAAGISEELTRKLVAALAGVDHLGTLLKVDAAVDEAIEATNLEFESSRGQGDLFTGFAKKKVTLSAEAAKATVLGNLERFLEAHSGADDLGLRLEGQQLASGVRFVRMVRPGRYDVVVGNPPYQGLSKTSLSDYVAKKYPRGKADLYAAFLERGLELVKEGGLSAMVTIRGWMFLAQFAPLRQVILKENGLLFGDLGWGAFEQMTDNPVTMSVIWRGHSKVSSFAICPGSPTDRIRTDENRRALEAGLRAHVGRYEFDPKAFEVIEGEPIVYWWTKAFLETYSRSPKIGVSSPARQGLITGDMIRFLREPWEIPAAPWACALNGATSAGPWVPYIRGAAGRKWFEDLESVVLWSDSGLQVRAFEVRGKQASRPQNDRWYFQKGVAFSMIGSECVSRAHRYPSIFGDKGSSVFPENIPSALCAMNRTVAREVLSSLNPSVSFQAGDVNRLPIFPVANSDEIFATIERAFTEHEAARENSVEFKRPGPSPWRYAQEWAQQSVDRPEGAPLPPYAPAYDPPEPASFVSFALGVALGRFGAQGEGILDRAPASALPHGILFLGHPGRDSLGHGACAGLHAAWQEHGAAVGEGDDLRTYLQRSFFDGHRRLYENRPIYFPLSSGKKSYVALVSIHRWQDDTLQVLLADHLLPEQRRLEGEIEDIRKARMEAQGKGKAERRFAEVKKLLEELGEFIAKVTEVAEHGPPAPDDKTPKREHDARFAMDLDDGVMVNSAALWPLLESQWKDPKKWWKELASAQGRKDYDWSHLAARYFPQRVAAKCVEDPSLAVAHKCFWQKHPAKAYAWELRLQDEIRPDFTIEEPDAADRRQRFLQDHPDQAAAAQAKESQRRARKSAKAEEADTPLLDTVEDEDSADA